MATRPTTGDDERWMRRALDLAEHGWGRVHPNPLVGAVVVAEGEIVGEGFHAEFGGPHAEVAALEAAGSRARDATLYVTLEPCAHHGKTPPCTDAVRAAGIARVVYATEDPGRESGGGGEQLAGAGVEVVGGVLRERARRQNAAFFHTVERGAPYVALKFGLSLDARIAEAPGRTTAITGEAAWREVHRLRAGFDAILVGAGTARVDDPLLTVRGAVEPRVAPRRVVFDTQARLRLDSRLVRTVGTAGVTLVCAEDVPRARIDALEDAGVRVLRASRVGASGGDGGNGAGGVRDAGRTGVAVQAGGVDVDRALEALWDDGIRTILCEGGARLAASLLEADRIERLYLYYAPTLLGRDAVPAFALDRPTPRRWHACEARRIGRDVLIVLERARRREETPTGFEG
ncbi:MAG: bifunctional diaminohydroxyphosphoribosylaminopyrimidine deaminase/5-amino-6-(5-phosphoribosylamino)uracil reductase RibD [Gemmatimonadota bacterium]